MEEMEKTLYITDLDGTLLNRRDRINPESIRIINSLVGQGMMFTYATARSLVSASVVTEGLTADIPVIVYNGAFIIKPRTGEILSSLSFSKEEGMFARETLAAHGINPLVYAYVDGIERVSWDTTRENDGIKHYLSRRTVDPRLRPLDSGRGLYDGDAFYYTCIGEKEEMVPVYKIFSADKRFRCTLQQELYRTEYWCEIMPVKATKAEAIRTLKKRLGCGRIVSFGDAVNDIPMFEISDECYAVENAVPELKRIATGVIADNEHDGVARWLFEHVRFKR